MEEKEEISRKIRERACPPPPPPQPQKTFKVETKICAIRGILEANLQKCSTLKFLMNISFVLSVCSHRSIIIIFIGKGMLVNFFLKKKYFSTIFYFHFHKNPRFRDEFQALPSDLLLVYTPPLFPVFTIQHEFLFTFSQCIVRGILIFTKLKFSMSELVYAGLQKCLFYF